MKEAKKTLWVVVEVYRGVPASVEAYDNYEIANIRLKEIKNRINLCDDAAAIFEIAV